MAREPFNPDRAVGGAGTPPPAKRSDRHIFGVAEITRTIKDAIEAALPPTVHVAGELSNCKYHSSGHVYFTLKDDACELTCVMWRSDAAKLPFKASDGMDVIVTGSISVFERTGRYQLYARRIEPRGVGSIELAFRQLCDKLRKEGLFESRHKQPLPAFPQRIAVITSATGAAVRDILDTLARRYPCGTVYLYPVTVQGPAAARSVASAIQSVNRRSQALGGIDVMIVGRGGGSAEDLAAFNDETLARAIFASRIPVISAVGHETDTTIADLVADVRAATPTAAAELATPRAADVLDEFTFRGTRLARALRHRLELANARLATATRRRSLADPLWTVRERREQCSQLARRLQAATNGCLHRAMLRTHELATLIQQLQPQRFLADQQGRLLALQHRLQRALAGVAQRSERRLEAKASRLRAASPQADIAMRRAHLGELHRRMHLAMTQGLKRRQERIDADAARLSALGYQETLRRGFSITRLERSGRVIHTVAEVPEGARLITEVADGRVHSRVIDKEQGDLFD
ncbi:MAG TPA: exodeoxyribonuclease VII large subunit [Phycisphaerae bacterium]|nr:exodeoxyribonuclease VII large subunit [Phycisphaerae bacterium]